MRAALALVLFAFALTVESGCIRWTNRDVVPRATISGRLRVGGPSSSASANRVLVASETNTGEVYRTRTNDIGDYTFFLPPGRYRLDVTLSSSEALARSNPVLELHPGQIKSDVDIDVVRSTADR